MCLCMYISMYVCNVCIYIYIRYNIHADNDTPRINIQMIVISNIPIIGYTAGGPSPPRKWPAECARRIRQAPYDSHWCVYRYIHVCVDINKNMILYVYLIWYVYIYIIIYVCLHFYFLGLVRKVQSDRDLNIQKTMVLTVQLTLW